METVLKPPRTGMEAFKLMPEGTFCQLIDNALVMSPAPLVQHARVQSIIFNQLFNYVSQGQPGEVYVAPVDVYLDEKNVYQPDIFFISNEQKHQIKKNGVYCAPDLVVEILSADRHYDLVVKKAVYEDAGVKEYWVVDPETKWCEGFALNNGIFNSVGQGTDYCNIRLFNLHVQF
ncbi:Uma2 family endonuclease [Segetibacter sp. 3557_3]|uniref:Uma2 family endonuclease n=1 Tax=Segetibacter sp. 3557_3 TaxID=2547429 RepID=UPI0010586F61|nr:Uma2 family endonuclease [Segetibacter sp. 3557_3]TDH23231.1 Uma2 family endonuclease [Segetibacter sp. 3557_3]